MKILLSCLLLLPLLAFSQDYPAEWFEEVPRSEAQSWEILPQDAGPGEVILSKRTELGIFSNFGATPFVLDGRTYASIEGLWQSLKFPDPDIESDQRHAVSGWIHSRQEVEQMVGFEAKRAGDRANQIYRDNNLSLVNYGTTFFNYTDRGFGSDYHYMIIKRAMREKLDQTPGLWELLMKTGCLVLKPDHSVNENSPPSFHYYKIYMLLRSERLFAPCPHGKN